MSVILLLLLASISVAALFLAAFLWSVKTGQYDDEISPPLRMLLDAPPLQSVIEPTDNNLSQPISLSTQQTLNPTN